MFEHPEEAVSPQKKQEEKLKARYPSSPATKAPGETATLPSFKSDSDNIRRIGRDVLLDVMDGKYKEKYDDVIVVDCRFEYEYDGGHIAGAVNLNTTDSLDKEFFNENKVRTGNTLMIFHCEYSAHRAPRM